MTWFQEILQHYRNSAFYNPLLLINPLVIFISFCSYSSNHKLNEQAIDSEIFLLVENNESYREGHLWKYAIEELVVDLSSQKLQQPDAVPY